MVTIKDIAAAAGVSATTVSLVINGKSEERRIAPETRDLILNLMNEMGYKPNISARRLRSEGSKKATIAFYWPSDYRANILSSFIAGFQKAAVDLKFDCELIIQTYRSGHLEEVAEPIRTNGYHGVIIGATSTEDDLYIDSLNLLMPVVVLNRKLTNRSTVNINNERMAQIAVDLFLKKGYKEAAIFTSSSPYQATGIRAQAFLAGCAEAGIEVQAKHIYRGDNSITGGVEMAQSYAVSADRPKAVFCDSDFIAMGAVHTFRQFGLRFPDDLEMLAIGFLDSELLEYSYPSVSTIYMSNEDVIYKALQIIIKKISSPKLPPMHDAVQPKLMLRDSFRMDIL